ncbi:MAG: MerR family transcriptional regulator [Spirochaetaceae bacterium]|nr:MerR family transcriptional regulator [Spirochaetaceae bacterium]
MASFGIGEVEELLGLPASTLRHWERVLPLLEPRKDAFGRRVYSESDLRLLLRLKHLAQRRGLGIGAAGETLVAELAAANPETRARLAELRGDLIGLFFQSRSSGRELGRRLAAERSAAERSAERAAAGRLGASRDEEERAGEPAAEDPRLP